MENSQQENGNEQIIKPEEQVNETEQDLQKQIAELEAKLTELKKSSLETTEMQSTKVAQKAEEFETSNPEETINIQNQLSSNEKQKEKTILEGEDELNKVVESPIGEAKVNQEESSVQQPELNVKEEVKLEEPTPHTEIVESTQPDIVTETPVVENKAEIPIETPLNAPLEENNAETNNEQKVEIQEPLVMEQNENFSEKTRYFSEQAAKKFEENNDRYNAAYEYKNLGNEEKAKDLMKQFAMKREAEEDFESAASLYEDAGDISKYTEMMNKDAEKQEENHRYRVAASHYEKAGNQEKAKEMHLLAAQSHEQREGDEFYAAEEYEKAGNQEKAKENFQKIIQKFESNQETTNRSELEHAAESYLKVGNQEKAKEVYIKLAEESYNAHDLKKSAEIYEIYGNHQKAQELAEEEAKSYIDLLKSNPYGGNYEDYDIISEIYKRAGNIEMSDKYNNYIEEDKKSRNNHQASIAEGLGDFAYARASYEKAGNQKKAKETASKLIDNINKLTEAEKQKLSPMELRYIAKAYKTLENQ